MKKLTTPSLRVSYSSQSNPRLGDCRVVTLLAMTLGLFVFTQSPVYAITATPSAKITLAKLASPSATPIPSPTDISLGDKIKNLVKENLSATESDLTQKINQKTLVGYVGTIKSISTENISLDSDDNLLQITTTTQTSFINAGKSIKASGLAIGNKVIVIGILIKSDIIQAKRIVIVVDDPNPVVTGTIFASVSSVDAKKKTISLTVNNEEVVYTLSKKSTIKIADIKFGQTIFAITKLYQGVNSLSRAKIF